MIAAWCQVCFPGGMVDKEDGTIIETSLREMQVGACVRAWAGLGRRRARLEPVHALPSLALAALSHASLWHRSLS